MILFKYRRRYEERDERRFRRGGGGGGEMRNQGGRDSKNILYPLDQLLGMFVYKIILPPDRKVLS